MTDKYMVTADEVRDVLADNRDRHGMPGDAPQVLSMLSIAEKILGDDPANGKPTAAYGGKSPEGWMNEHLSVAHLKKVLAGLEQDGVIVKFTKPTYRSTPAERSRARLVRFPYRTVSGYTLTEFVEESSALKEAEKRDGRRLDLRREARDQVLAKHQADVEKAYVALCRKAKLDPALETNPTPE